MTLTTSVLAGGITHLTDARYFAAWGVEWLGFPLGRHGTEGITPNQFHALREWLEGPKFVGEYGFVESVGEVLAQANELKLDALRLGAHVDRETARLLAAKLPVLQEIAIEGYVPAQETSSALAERSEWTTAFILHFDRGGIQLQDLRMGRPYSLEVVRRWSEQFPIILSIDLNDTAAADLIEELPALTGLAVQGGEEEAVGMKSFDDLDGFFESLEKEL
ncbi:MAG: hypothetical protein WBA17_11440 [Saprospiraceae bacterium]